GKSVAETKELLQKNKELRAKPTKPKEYIKIDYHQQHYTTKDLEKLEAMLQDRQEVLKNINEKISYYKAKTDEIKARNADDEKKYNDLYFSTAETDEATREAIWQQMKAIKENNAAFLKQNQRIVDTYFGYQRKANKIESEIEFLQDKITKLEAQKVDSSDIIFTDKKGKEHTLTKEVQEQWRETFNLKSLDESYIPKHSDEILQALGGKEIKLQLGSLKKLVAQGREQYIPQIKEVLDSPEAILKDSDNAFLFAKHLKDDDYFVNVSVDKGEYLVSISNGIKETSNIKNKVENGAEVVYQSPNANSNLQTLLQTSRYSANKIDSDIIPQMPKDNPQLVALQTKIQQSRQQIAESKNPDKEYLYQVFKPDEIIELEKQYFNQAMPQEYKELIQDFPRLYEQSLANELKTYAKDADTIQEVTTQLLNDFKDKPFKDTAKHAELLLFNTLRDKAQELGFKELDINTPSFKVAFGKFQAKLKKGDIQDLSEHIATSSLRKNRLRIEQSLNIKPLAEFGENYAEHYHSGESAIAKLLNEKQGQVSGAFYRKELGDIDLVWGDSNFGLKHILQERTKQWGEEKALRFISHLSENIQKGHIVEVEKGRIGIKTELTTIILDKKDGNNFVITAFRDSGNKKELESLNLIQSKALTSENAGTNAKESPVTSLNQESIIPQTPQEIIKQAKEQGKSVTETAENNTNAWQKEFIEKIKNDESGKILGHYTQGEALVIERKINDRDLDLISITKGENGELFTTYLGKFITRQEAQKRKSFLDNGFKGKEKELLEFLEKEPVDIGSERI
ncbi:PBECR2 nuclease fold domain-containing protein, partial [Helicobacter cinaedi]|uniref:putative barnase/colicin E5 family endoribonuclease n=1 Tax=Helicobacter cinaedi TaxID=213 RepID=UPI002277CE84